MRGIVFHGERELELATFPDPTPGPGELVIEVMASGMCGSDLHRYRGPKATARSEIGGHEPAGVVAAVGSGADPAWIGQAVMVHHYFGCGRCDQCRMGWTQLCREGTAAMGNTAHGSHADLVKVPESTVLPMPPGLSYLGAAAIGCGTGTAWGALERLSLTGSDTIAIFGQGPVGLAATQLASAMGARVIALDISPSRLARSHDFGAWATVNPAEVDSVDLAVRELTMGRGVSKSLETSGASSAANDALHVLDLWGSACWVGVGSTIQFDLTEHLYKQITAMTSWTMSIASMARCADFVVERDIDVDAVFTERWKLTDYAAAYELFDQQTSGKGVFIN
ncbi:threonine dehydrogenase-like Zn-dependent dehydrogenase [Kribbella sp. VKM Ac-2527]|uniref:Threonine dehydrogenase-like Zn-dependent dehydrogenase n=1 Tax=Kribbella caucasensis TaxID=2512215 RepID=A0A4R6KNG5_9ACTN|nr:zinc-binding dehydrogenase [Kribbella sp. VKM Ac-2527]TDO51650.1 threonine dehydrogenase-like Zn-dependent dehydrogenase [Kribbella sp. VKM Ac-2527]